MSTKAEKIEAQARAYFAHRHAVGPVELRKLMEAQEILREMVRQFEGVSQFYIDYAPGGDVAEKGITSLIRRAKEVV